MWVGLFFSFSQSSFVALAAGVFVAAVVVWGRSAVVVSAVVVLLLALGSLAVPQVRHRVEAKSRSGVDSVTSDRATLVGQGLRIALAHPLGGVGAGGFRRAYAERAGLPGKRPKKAASHTTPVTVAAEEGLPGLVLFGWLCRGRAPRRPPGPRQRLHVARVVRRGPYASGDHRAQLLLQRASSRTR